MKCRGFVVTFRHGRRWRYLFLRIQSVGLQKNKRSHYTRIVKWTKTKVRCR